ncbi:peptidoglycan DD-metalloendopeptidase family protein [Staphylococcus nepalensis]|uniref:Probable transglycosylase IsaA n=1 Tax=Staphylococcus nepalensis TaxID=214473 RepID=A0ABS3L690_9STAP|nr:peptidoglycan DD-metalloendopeptidase family protein [Staphylococcus nepalensis]MBO1214080.1 peptidoglycan DD-metalloendopeptidase family protein [Staphylococcus nepalensis]MBO1228236.1 peptidoglycan DD-metalloendopeptidase family protein [Staphylococcus nepalensis]MBO1233768.1 peptidoglycan DD-metalloendopeptidase family protein [Staphylococcus nepalensis]MBO1236542.1 peptidoglycan DD-metalloendopeptidase family protein [Staphylococcus nepalensis]
MAEQFNLGARVSMDLNPFAQSSRVLDSMLKSNNKALKSQEKAFKGSSMSAQDLAEREGELSRAVKNSEAQLEKKKEELNKLKSSIGDVNNATDQQKTQLTRANAAVSEAQQNYRGYKNQLTDVQYKQRQLNASTSSLQTEMQELDVQTKKTAAEQRRNGNEAGALKTEYSGLGRQVEILNTVIGKEQSKLSDLKATKGEDASETQRQEKNVQGLMKQQSSLISQQDKVGSSIEKMSEHSGRAGKSFSDMWAVFKGSFLAQGVMSIISKVTGAIKNMFQGAIERMDSLYTGQKSLELILGSGKKANAVMDDISKSIEGTSIPLDQITESTKRLVASGVEMEEIGPMLKAITDQAYGMGKGSQDIDQLADAFQELSSSETAEYGTISRLRQNGVQALQILANKYGVSIEEMKDKLSDGEIKSKDAMNKLIDGIEKGTDGVAGSTAKLEGQAKMSGETIGGSLANVATRIKANMATMFESARGPIVNMFQGMTKAIDSFGSKASEKLAPVIEAIANGFKNMNPHTKAAIGIIAVLGTTATIAAVGVGALSAVLGFILSPVALIAGGITALAGAFVIAWTKSQTFRNVLINSFNGIIAFLQPAITAIKNFALEIGSQLKQFWKENGAVITQAIRNIGKVISTVMNNVILPVMKFVWSLVKYIIVSTWDAIKGTIKGALDIIMGVVKIFAGLFTGNWKTMWSGIKQAASGALKFLWNFIQLMFVGRILKVGKLFAKMFGGIFPKLWGKIKGIFSKFGQSIWNNTKRIFTGIFNTTKSIFTNTYKFLANIWKIIRNSVVKLVRSLFNSVKKTFSSLFKSISRISKNIRNFVTSSFRKTKDGVVNFATKLKDGAVNRFNSMKKTLSNIGQSIKDNTVGKFKGLFEGAKSWLNKLKQWIVDAKEGFKKVAKDLGNSVANGAINGLNAMIDGINWLSDKIMKKKLIKNKVKTLSTGTGASPTVSTDSEGRLTKPTKAIVNDKGLGNAKGPNGHREVIHRRNGKVEKPIGRNKRVNLHKGDAVLNGIQSRTLIPHLSTGTGTELLKRGKKHKKHDEVYGDVPTKGGGGSWNPATAIADGAKGAWSWTEDKAKKAKDSISKAIGDVMEYATNPGKLINKMLKHFGVDFSGIKGAMGGTMSWAYNGLKKGIKDLVTGWFTELEGDGDGGYIDLSKGINFPFSPNGRAPGYPFAGPHMGVDINYIYDKLYSVLAGKATARKGWNGGFGNMVDIVSGATKVIYGHMSKHAFSGSKNVKPGDYLGVSGNTGMSSGPHLHFEVQKNGVPIDPIAWLKKNNGGGKAGGKYASTIKKALGLAGLPQTDKYIKAWQSQAKTESTFNPKAKNPSGASGLVQVKPATFNQYKLPGHGNIWNPLDNLIAGMRYAKARYGPKKMLNRIGHGLPYAKGTDNATRGLHPVFEKGGEIINFKGGDQVIPNDVSIAAIKETLRSNLFAKTQSAVYDGISRYADEIRRQEAIKEQQEYNDLARARQESNDLKEQNSILKEMLYTMQDILQSSRNNENYNSRTANKDMTLDGKKVARDTSRQQGKDMMSAMYNMGGAF